ncbi:DsrE family protein [Pyrobaculum calidifontis]|uniref:Uncharacterized protein n=1 Tax=Pyrobaculum calidifontis (strain DSM 21063 / JCM 11548 / VA1) TaxID=410359 RepID=A3MW76_PYRCJ|nr:DsrE family protein [Pyrobaculum calidifontis]ABO08893.1 conserved hypothetical protein [Pyrobaculum calidifontis JCM 11548]
MAFGIIVGSGDFVRLYEFATLVSTLVARGEEVSIFVTGEAVKAFKKEYAPPLSSPEHKRIVELGVDWKSLLSTAKSIGSVKVYVCETASKIFGISEEEYDPALVDKVTSMYTFLEEVDRLVVF